MPLLEARKQYKPFEYPWAFEYWKRQQQIHWMPEEVPLGEDCRDWAQKLDQTRAQPADPDLPLLHPGRRRGAGLLPRQIRPRVQADRDQDDADRVLQHGDGAHRRLLAPARHDRHARERIWRLPPVQGDEGQARLPVSTFGVDSDEDIAKTLAMFGGFTEGLQLFASFAMLMNFPRFNKMKGMGQIVSWSVRDESLHCEGIIKLFHAFVKERDCLTPAVKEDDHRHLPEDGAARGRVHRPRVRDGAGQRHEPQGDQEVHPLHRRLAPRASSASRRSTWSTSTRSPGSPRCSTASSTPTSSKPARPNIRRPRRGATGTACGTISTGGRRRRRMRRRTTGAAQRRRAGYVRGAGVAAE